MTNAQLLYKMFANKLNPEVANLSLLCDFLKVPKN